MVSPKKVDNDAAAADSPAPQNRLMKEIASHNLGATMATPTKEREDRSKRSRHPPEFLTVGNGGGKQKQPLSPLGMDGPQPIAKRFLRRRGSSVFSEEYLHLRVAKQVDEDDDNNDAYHFGTVVELKKDNLGIERFCILYDDGTEEILTKSVLVRHCLTMYNKHYKHDTSRPVAEKSLPTPRSRINPFEKKLPPKTPPVGKKANRTKQQRSQKKNSTPSKSKTAESPNKKKRGRPPKKVPLASSGRPTKKGKSHLHDEDGKTIETHGNYDGESPYFYEQRYNEKKNQPPTYEPIFELNDSDMHEPEFKLDAAGFGDDTTKPSPEVLSNLILPDHLITEIVHRLNKYVRWRTTQSKFQLDENGEFVIDEKTTLKKKNNNYLDPRIAENTPDITKSGKTMFMCLFHSCSGFQFFPMLLLYVLKRASNELNSQSPSYLFFRHT